MSTTYSGAELIFEASPIFVIGRQHSGNTMLTTVLERSPDVFCLKGEGNFFGHRRQVDRMAPRSKARRIAQLIRGGADHSQSIADELLEVLIDDAQSTRPAPSASALYARAMQYLTAQRGKARWAQKATSYIFHVDAILEVFPDARLVFLARNPLDLAASTKRRNVAPGRLMRMTWGWNRGIRLARQHQRAHPDNVLVVRYEDLARKPHTTLEDIFDFAGLTFDLSYLRVAHVNRSETPYNTASQQRGINASRVFYYQDVLTSEEEMCVRLLADQSLLEALYPDLPAPRACLSIQHAPAVARFFASGGRHLAKDIMQQFRSRPRYALRRVRERLL